MARPIHRPLLNFIRRAMRQQRQPIPLDFLWRQLEEVYSTRHVTWMKNMTTEDWLVELFNLAARSRINIIEGKIHDICLTEKPPGESEEPRDD